MTPERSARHLGDDFRRWLVSAHPGRTDASGGHTCWTNCSKWGLEYGEYHYHNGGSSSSGSSSSSNTSKNNSSSKSTSRKSAAPTYKASGLKVYINGQKISFNSEPVIYQNTNLVPLREIAEGLGATITCDKDTGTIGGTRQGTRQDGIAAVAYTVRISSGADHRVACQIE
ncbi:YHYH domain-containing protein [Paenibacillus sp. S28]|nr:YHYH domain-containing protein [Paenibacillus sp. S28]